MTYEPHLLMPGQTIEAIIRLKNSMVHGEELKRLVEEFNKKNAGVIPYAGVSVLIPISQF